ncbi:chemotaxis protein CheA [Thermoanaerobacteraceae bacterium SP2]|nr:chemotaxis protein CheA [Thermoanaerobacteraceae bacterium SP2]
MLDIFIFETRQLLEQLEQVIINSEKKSCYGQDEINQIFRIMHTIKGSSAMMLFNDISALAHVIEDLFYFLREEKPLDMDYPGLCDIVLESVDFIKDEMQKIENGQSPDGDASSLIDNIKSFLTTLKELNHKEYASGAKEQSVTDGKIHGNCISHSKTEMSSKKRNFKATVYFEEGCEMENIRAYTIIHNLKDITEEVYYIPADIIDNDNSVEIIRKEGFQIWLKTDRSFEEMHHFFSQTIFLKDLELVELDNNEEFKQFTNKKIVLEDSSPVKILKTDKESEENGLERDTQLVSSHQSIISVSVTKLDKLMDLVGELVISEAMVTQNPDLAGLILDNFQKAARQHRKIINELQDIAMSIRMVPLSTTFQKMNRVVRDMSKKLSKEVRLEIIGEETEVDKNIIEHISDPLMHLIRNSIDHGIESAEERKAKGKPEAGTVTLEAKNAGGDVLIIVKDDGRGLNKEKILKKARENGLINRPESELTDKDIYSYIFLPGFSTKDKVTEFSGRGVGMDVVTKNIGAVGGTVSVDSVPGEETTITLKIPLTLAIMDGMTIRVGKSTYTIPIISIKESFKAKEGDVITDPDGNEMIRIRGECYPVLRLHELYKVKTEITNIPDGIIVMAENEGKGLCIFADELIGEQQVVVKALPNYIRNIKKVRGVAGCTLLGDGSISLILDVADLLKN